MNRLTFVLLLSVFATWSYAAEETVAASPTDDSRYLTWSELPPMPPAPGQTEQPGLAGAFVGVHNDALLVAGGANFPDAPPWENGGKVWWDFVYVLRKTDDGGYSWITGENLRLPRPIAYGVSIPTDDGILCIGGCDAKQCYADAFLLQWDPGGERITTEALPPLPQPLAFAAGARVGDTIFVAGGQETMTDARATTAVYALDWSKRGDPKAFQWRAIDPWRGPPRILAVAAGQNDGESDCLFLFSGRDIAPGRPTVILTDAYKYNPRTEQWTRLSDVAPQGDSPRCIMGAPVAAAGVNHVLVFGGVGGDLFLELEALDQEIAASTGTADALTQKKRGILTNHPGFSRDILSYSAITDTWAKVGTIPTSAPVTTTAAKWDGAFILPTGEISPGIRTTAVWRAEPTAAPHFRAMSYVVLGVYLAVLVLMGLYFSRRMQSTDDFFRAGKRIPWWAAGVSIYATQLSAITFMAIPAKTFATDWRYFMGNMAIVVVAPFVVFVFLPFYRRLDVTTAYEYLEQRFNLPTRLLGSVAFMFLQFCRIGIVLLLPAIALSIATGFDVRLCVFLMGVLCIVYTVLGGIEAVVWTDVIQTFVLVGGALVCVVLIALRLPEGWSGLVGAAHGAGKFHMFDFRFNFAESTFFVLLLGGMAQNFFSYGADQVVVQRYLTTRDEKSAANSIWTNAVLVVPGSILFFLVGTALFAYYAANPGELSPTLQKGDAIFAYFIVTQLPAAAAGLVIAGLFAASMSSLDSSMNSVATAITTDFYRRLTPGASDRHCLTLARWLTFVVGAVGTGVSLLLAGSDVQSLWDASAFYVGLFGSGLAGVFLLGIFTRRAHAAGAIIGLVLSIALQVVFKQTTGLHPWIIALSNLVCCFVIGYAASLLIPAARKPLEGLTFYTVGRRVD